MTTLTSNFPYSGIIPSSHPHKTRLTKDRRTSPEAVRTSAPIHLAGKLEKASSNSPEKFYQDHVIAIFLGIYLETMMSPILGTLGIYLYSHWMM